jgi:hypothetical protein
VKTVPKLEEEEEEEEKGRTLGVEGNYIYLHTLIRNIVIFLL